MLEPQDAAILQSVKGVVDSLNRALIGPSEVALHDLSAPPYPIIAISGDLTGRSVGGPASEMLLRAARTGDFSTLVGYESRLPNGPTLRISTIIVGGASGQPLAALCLISDVSMWGPVREFIEAVLPGGHWPGQPVDQPPVDPEDEGFATDIDELAARLLQRAISDVGVPVELMHKRHKLAVVERLQGKGFFQLKDSPERAAAALEVSRYTIYNYLNEIAEAGAQES
nr:helix-turn-helix domain-containing protein [uncultured Tessaracoccus sp.]